MINTKMVELNLIYNCIICKQFYIINMINTKMSELNLFVLNNK